jgi:hypothetical protein
MHESAELHPGSIGQSPQLYDTSDRQGSNLHPPLRGRSTSLAHGRTLATAERCAVRTSTSQEVGGPHPIRPVPLCQPPAEDEWPVPR